MVGLNLGGLVVHLVVEGGGPVVAPQRLEGRSACRTYNSIGVGIGICTGIGKGIDIDIGVSIVVGTGLFIVVI